MLLFNYPSCILHILPNFIGIVTDKKICATFLHTVIYSHHLTISTSISSCNINMNHLPLQASELMTDWRTAGNRIPTPRVVRMESTCSLIILSRKPLSTETPRPCIYNINIIPSLSKQFTNFLKCLKKTHNTQICFYSNHGKILDCWVIYV